MPHHSVVAKQLCLGKVGLSGGRARFAGADGAWTAAATLTAPAKGANVLCRLRCALSAAPRDVARHYPLGRVVVAQIETANPNTRGLNTSVFSSEDLSFLQMIVDELLAGLIASGDNVVQGDGREALKRDLARTIFASARPGERDAASLKQLVMRSRIASGRRPPDL